MEVLFALVMLLNVLGEKTRVNNSGQTICAGVRENDKKWPTFKV